LKITLETTQRVLAEKNVIAGKVPLLESDNDDLKIKMERYKANNEKILEEINVMEIDRNKFRNKVEEMLKNPQITVGANKSRVGISMRGATRSAMGTSETSGINHGKNIFNCT